MLIQMPLPYLNNNVFEFDQKTKELLKNTITKINANVKIPLSVVDLI